MHYFSNLNYWFRHQDCTTLLSQNRQDSHRGPYWNRPSGWNFLFLRQRGNKAQLWWLRKSLRPSLYGFLRRLRWGREADILPQSARCCRYKLGRPQHSELKIEPTLQVL